MVAQSWRNDTNTTTAMPEYFLFEVLEVFQISDILLMLILNSCGKVIVSRGRRFDCCVVKETRGGLRKAQTPNGSK